MSDLPAFEEVHVISDIHMGGKPGFQILRETNRLANFIRWVAKQRPDGRVQFSINRSGRVVRAKPVADGG